ncbi:hypothetical protein F52700_6608 [Fusarium sp. NRRL 52700]|nr:hypothetical protein F52700_6608 [Fusarium sp. NRRL 52700]
MASHDLREASPSSLRPPVDHVESLIPVEVYELRLALIEDIRKVMRQIRGPQWPDLAGLEYSYLINMPLDKLRPLKVLFYAFVPFINDLILQKNDLPEQSQNSPSTNKATEVDRSEALRKEYLGLDGNYCVVTNALR